MADAGDSLVELLFFDTFSHENTEVWFRVISYLMMRVFFVQIMRLHFNEIGGNSRVSPSMIGGRSTLSCSKRDTSFTTIIQTSISLLLNIIYKYGFIFHDFTFGG